MRPLKSTRLNARFGPVRYIQIVMELAQFEINLAPYLETAQAFPEAAEMHELLDLLDRAIVDRPLSEQLESAGSTIALLADVFEQKFAITLDKWEAKYHPREPVVPDLAGCIDLFVQGQQFRLDDLLEEPVEHYYPAERKSATGSGSIVAEMTPAAMLAVIEALPSLEQIQGLAHSESIDAWVEIVDQVLTETMSLRDLQVKTGLAIVPLWLALLFGEFAIGREGDFYEGAVFVTPDRSTTAIAPTDADRFLQSESHRRKFQPRRSICD
jgi:hypothetical protein